MRRRHAAATCTWLMAAALLGCEREPRREEAVPLKDVPAAALKAARKALPDVHFEAAWKAEDKGGGPAFEIRGHTRNGRTRDARVTPDGRVLEVD
jgi:hypothetical protein